MNNYEQQRDDDSLIEFRQEFTDDLEALYTPDTQLPSQVDRAILDMAGQKITRPAPRRIFWRIAAGAAAAAVVMAGVMLWHPNQSDQMDKLPGSNELAFTAREDIDQNGQVDILDAFALARHVKQADILNKKWDINGDGIINQGDVDLIAMTAVKL